MGWTVRIVLGIALFVGGIGVLIVAKRRHDLGRCDGLHGKTLSVHTNAFRFRHAIVKMFVLGLFLALAGIMVGLGYF